MRLIDADALRMLWLDEDPNLEFEINTVLDSIDEQPTIDAEPVRHGRWEKRDGKTWCSLCGASNKAYEPPYCPHCGNPMDGGVSND